MFKNTNEHTHIYSPHFSTTSFDTRSFTSSTWTKGHFLKVSYHTETVSVIHNDKYIIERGHCQHTLSPGSPLSPFMPELPTSPCIEDIHNFRLNMFVNGQSPNRVEDTVIGVQISYYIQACEARNSRGSPLTGFPSASPSLLSLGRYSNTVTHIIHKSLMSAQNSH